MAEVTAAKVRLDTEKAADCSEVANLKPGFHCAAHKGKKENCKVPLAPRATQVDVPICKAPAQGTESLLPSLKPRI